MQGVPEQEHGTALTALQARQIYAGEQGSSHEVASNCWQIRDNFLFFSRSFVTIMDALGQEMTCCHGTVQFPMSQAG